MSRRLRTFCWAFLGAALPAAFWIFFWVAFWLDWWQPRDVYLPNGLGEGVAFVFLPWLGVLAGVLVARGTSRLYLAPTMLLVWMLLTFLAGYIAYSAFGWFHATTSAAALTLGFLPLNAAGALAATLTGYVVYRLRRQGAKISKPVEAETTAEP